jgi:hypothetical protein
LSRYQVGIRWNDNTCGKVVIKKFGHTERQGIRTTSRPFKDVVSEAAAAVAIALAPLSTADRIEKNATAPGTRACRVCLLPHNSLSTEKIQVFQVLEQVIKAGNRLIYSICSTNWSSI